MRFLAKTIAAGAIGVSALMAAHSGANVAHAADVANAVDTSDLVAVTLTIANKTWTAHLANNATTQELLKRFPVTIQMNEFGGFEKSYYFNDSLPQDVTPPGYVNIGEITLYGPHYLVLFYKSFDNSYAYTRLGQVDNVAGLVEALGQGNVSVTWDKAK